MKHFLLRYSTVFWHRFALRNKQSLVKLVPPYRATLAFTLFFLAIGVSETMAQCGQATSNYANHSAPTSTSFITTTTCHYGGEYAIMSGGIAGAVYEYETCGDTDFDTQLTVRYGYGGTVLAYNDDACGVQSRVSWTQPGTGDVYISIHRYNCTSQSTCMTLKARRVSVPVCSGYEIALETGPTFTPASGCNNGSVRVGGGGYYDIAVAQNTYYNWTAPSSFTANVNQMRIRPLNGNGSTVTLAAGGTSNNWFSGTTTTVRVSTNRTSCNWVSTSAILTYRHSSPSLTANSPTSSNFCAGGTASISAGTATNGYAYWQGTTSNGTSTGTPGSPNTVSTAGTYYYRPNNNGCWGTQQATTVTVSSPSVALSATADPAGICSGSTTLTVNTPQATGGLLDRSTWAVGSGSAPGFNQNGSTAENNRINGTDPWGNSSVVWETSPTGGSDADGGWNSSIFPVDATKLYRFSVWVQRTSVTTTGTFYLGLNNFNSGGSNIGTENLSNGATNTNPYWDCTNIGALPYNEWVLVTGHVYPEGTTYTGKHPETGRWNLNGVNIAPTGCNTGTGDVRWKAGTVSARHRTYHYYSSSTTAHLQFLYPRVDIIDGTEPSLQDLINGFDVNGGLGTGATWEWNASSCGGSSAGTGTSISVSPTVSTDYFVRAVGTCNTSACTNATVTVNQLPTVPTITASGTTTLCGGGSVTLTAESSLAGRALDFNGSGQHVSMGNPGALQITGNQTIEMWLNPDNFSARRNPYNKAYGGEGTITQEPAGNLNYYWGTSGANANPYQGFNSGATLNLNQWNHIAIVRDLTSNQLRWYINGVLTNTATPSFSSATASNNSVLIGTGYAGAYDGTIDEVRVWEVARTTAEIQANMNTTIEPGTPGLAGYWRMDEASGTQVLDASGNSTTGVFASGSPTRVTSTAPLTPEFTWSPATGLNTTTGSVVTANPTSSQTYTVSAASPHGCGNSTNTQSIIAYPAFTAGTIPSTGQTICYGGDPATIGSTTAASGGDGSITYEWRANGSPIPGSNSATYNPPSGLTTTTTYTRWAHDNTCNPTFTQSSGSWQVTVNGQLAGGTISSSQTICYNTAPTALTGTAATGGTGSFNYQWQSSPNGSTWSNISGATNTGYAPGALTTTTHYRRVATTTCGTINSNTIIITVGNSTTVGAGSSTPTVCINNTIPSITHSIPSDVTGITNISNLPTGVSASWSSGLITISGTPSTSGTFNYSIELVGGCLNGANATGTITVNPYNTITRTSAAGTDAQTTCVNTAITNITYATTGATGATISGLPAGVTGTWSGNVVTISGTPTTTVGSPFNYTVTMTGGCTGGTNTATGTITVNPTNTITRTSAAGTDAQTTCVNTAITNITYATTGATGATISGLPAGVTGTWSGNVVTISGTPTTTVGSPFNYTVTMTGGCTGGTNTATGTITVTPTNTITRTSAAGTDAQTTCVNTAITNITYATTGATGATVSGLPAGVTGTWSGNVVTISGTPTTTVGSPFNYTVAMTGGCTGGTNTATGTITVNPSQPASVSITASATTICPGTSVTFTATPTNGGTPSYQWKIGSTNVGTNSSTFTTTSLSDGDVVTVVMTSTATCATGSPATSNQETITVISPATPVMSVTSQPTCSSPGGTIEISSPLGGAYEYALNGGTYQSSPVFTGLAPGNYSATVRLAASPTCQSTPNASLTINSTPSALPPMTPVFVCQNGSGTLVSNNNCIENFVIPFNTNSIYYGWAASGDPTAAVPTGTVNTTVCSFGGPTRTYSIVEFQVSLTGDYIFEMNDNPAYNGVGYIYTGNFTPGTCGSGTLVRADNNSGTGNEPRLGGAGGSGPMTLTAGVTYSLVSSTEGPSDVTGADYTWTITPPTGGDIMLNEPGNVQWYTAASGGSPIYTGQNFNPVGVPGSGLSNTNTAGTWTYYAACSSSPSCRTAADFTITNTTTLFNITPGGATCYDASSPVSVGISGSLNGMVYRLYRDGVYAGSQATGTGSAITVGITSAPGIYTVVAVIGTTCVIPMNGTVEIKPVPIANAGTDVTLCNPNPPTVTLSGSSNPSVIATEDFGNVNDTELTPTTSDWRLHYLYNTHPGNRTEWHIGNASGSTTGPPPYSMSCAASGAALGTVDHRQFQTDVPCDYAWDHGEMDEIAYKITPIDARLYTSVTVSFDFMANGNYTGGIVRDYYQVMYSLDNGATWVAVNAGNNTGSYTLRNGLNGTTNAFFSLTGTPVTGTANVTMPAAVAGDYFLLGFRWTNDGNSSGDNVDNMMIDNIVVSGTPDYSWNPTTGVTGANTATPTVTQPGTYTVTVTAGNGCSSTDVVEVLPRAEITNVSTSVCSGNSFNATPVDGTNGTVPSGTTYSWSAPSVAGITGATSGSGASAVTGTLTNTTNAAIDVIYSITPTANGCVSPAFTATVTVNPTPTISNITETVCSGASFSVTPVNGTNGIVPTGTTYSWSAPVVTGGMTGGAASSGTPTSVTGTLSNTTSSVQTATYTVTTTSGSCTSSFTVTVSVSPAVTAPTAITYTGTEPTCQLTSSSTTDYNSTTSVGTLSWSLTAITNTNGSIGTGAIDPNTGVVTWPSGWAGSVTINVVSTGCNGPSAATTRTVSVQPAVGTPTAISISAGSEPPCQLTNATTTTTYSTTATNSSGFTWSISNPAAGSINTTTGVMTWANGFTGSVDIQVTATGCNGQSAQVIRTVTVGQTVGTPTPITYTGTEPNCQITNSTTITNYATTATNHTTLNWSINNPLAGSIHPTTGVMTWANGFFGTVVIRVTASGCNGPSVQVTRTVNIGIGVINPGYRTWTGLALDQLWENDGNWDCGGVPTAIDQVIIPEIPVAGVSETPRIENGITGHCLTIRVEGNIADRIEIETGGVLRVHQ